jgi:hypothetical protein
MDKIERIKRYLEESKKEKLSQPITLDLSKLVDVNHAKTFATKYELGKELVNLTSDYTKRLEDIRQDVRLSDSQIIGNIERLNIKLADNISGLIKKIDSDKVQLSDSFLQKLDEQVKELNTRIELVNEPVFTVIADSERKIGSLESIIGQLGARISNLIIPKQVIVKAGKNVSVNTKETEKGIEYTINSSSVELTRLYNNIQQGGGGGTLYAGDNILIEGLTISALVSGATINAGYGIDITGKTVTNILPGISLQAGDNITIQGVTISAIGSAGMSLTDNLAEGVSNFYYRGDRFVGIGGASVSYAGKTVTIYSQSSGSPAWGDITGGLTAQTDLYAELVTKISGTSTTNLLNEGTSNFYYNPKTFIGTGGVSVSVSGKTITIFGLSAKLNTNDLTEGASGLFYSGQRFTSDFATKTTNDLSQGTSNFYYNPASYVGTGGVSVSVVGKTVTIFGLSSAINSNQVSEGISNFYYKPSYFVGTGGVSVSVSGKTVTIFGLSTKLNTNDLTEGSSGLFYSVVRFNADLSTKTTNDISEGTSNFYHRVSRFVGTGGASVSGTGITLTIYGASTKVNTNETTEGASGLYYSTARFTTDFGNKTTNDLAQGTSNFYYNPLTHVGTGGVSVSINGKTLTFYGASTKVNTNEVTEGASGLFYSSVRFDASFGGKNTDNLSQGVSNFYYNPLSFVGSVGTSVSVTGKTVTIYSAIGGGATILGFVGTGGASVSQSGATYTIFTPVPGAPTIYGGLGIGVDGSTITNLHGYVGTGGVSVSITGNTYTFFGLSTKVNTNDVTEGASGLFYSSVRFDASLATKTTNNLSEGTSNFYYRADRFVGTGGVSVSATGLTLTIFGLSTALNSNQISEGTSNFYWTPSRLKAGTGISIFVSGLSAQIGFNLSGVSAQYLNGVGTWEAEEWHKSFFLEGATATDFIPFFRVDESCVLTRTIYDISGGTQWVGQVQKWNNAQGGVKTDTQAADSGVTTTLSVISYTGASFLAGEYMAIKGASVAGGISWLLVNVYFREN